MSKSESYCDLMHFILHVNSCNPVLPVVTKLMNQLVGGWDWSAMEVYHFLNIPLCKVRRTNKDNCTQNEYYQVEN